MKEKGKPKNIITHSAGYRCYKCGRLVAKKGQKSREHIPANSFFQQDRKNCNLITIPSCKKHNEGKADVDNLVSIYFRLMSDPSHNNYDALNKSLDNLVATSNNNGEYNGMIAVINDNIKKANKWRNQGLSESEIEKNLSRDGTYFDPFTVLSLQKWIEYMDMLAAGVYYHKNKKLLKDSDTPHLGEITIAQGGCGTEVIIDSIGEKMTDLLKKCNVTTIKKNDIFHCGMLVDDNPRDKRKVIVIEFFYNKNNKIYNVHIHLIYHEIKCTKVRAKIFGSGLLLLPRNCLKIDV